MSSPFLAEIRIFGCNFAPRGWALCDGQLLSISQNTALFSLLGTTYGGDGRTNFALPNLQGSAPMQAGQGPGLSDYVLGEQGGEGAVTLLSTEIPAHTHTVQGNASGASSPNPVGHVWAQTRGMLYASSGSTPMASPTTSSAGSSLPHNNLPPFLVLNFCIALQGVFPARP